MQELNAMLESQKEAIEKELKEIGHKEFELKVNKSKLNKMLTVINRQLATAKGEPTGKAEA